MEFPRTSKLLKNQDDFKGDLEDGLDSAEKSHMQTFTPISSYVLLPSFLMTDATFNSLKEPPIKKFVFISNDD
jgi:hypothetical protein